MTTWRYDNGDTLTILALGGAVRIEVKMHQGPVINLTGDIASTEQIRDELTRAMEFAKGPPRPPTKPEIPER
jgi:hypothetical protein